MIDVAVPVELTPTFSAEDSVVAKCKAAGVRYGVMPRVGQWVIYDTKKERADGGCDDLLSALNRCAQRQETYHR